jgi:hypothetical protein
VTLKLSNIVTAYQQYQQDAVASAKACVEQGGGIWVGTMDEGRLALFNSPQTGSTLALKITAITPELVAAKIRVSDRKFAKW